MPIGRQRSTIAKPADIERTWYRVDAQGKILGRLASQIACVLMGKHKPTYTPHVDTGDCVVVNNVEKLRITGNKLDDRTYARFTYYPGGYKELPMREVFEKHPDRVLTEAVRRMLPKNALGRRMLKKLKCYRGDAHPHAAQQPVEWAF